MLTTTILNALLALGVIVMVLTPLVWAILTQHRDHPCSAVNHNVSDPALQGREHRRVGRSPSRRSRAEPEPEGAPAPRPFEPGPEKAPAPRPVEPEPDGVPAPRPV